MTADAVDRVAAQSCRVQQENVRLRAEAADLRAEAADLRAEAVRLRAALTSRIVIEQAVGIVAEKQRVTVAAAFVLLRDHCRNHHRTLHDVSAGIVAGQGRQAA